jgi:hypothetical protein
MSKRQRYTNQNVRRPSQLPIELRHRIGEFCGLSYAIRHERLLDVLDQLDAMQQCVLNAYSEMDFYLGADELSDADIVDMRFPAVSKKLQLLQKARICECGEVCGFQDHFCESCDYRGRCVRAVHECRVCEQDEAPLCSCANARYCSDVCKQKDWRNHRRAHRM